MVLPDSDGVSRAPPYSGTGSRRLVHFVNGAITRYGQTFQTVRLCTNLVTPRVIPNRPHNPEKTEVLPVWAFPLSLATTDGITFCFLLLRVLRCFSSPRSPHATMYSSHDTGALPPVGCPIRKSPDQSLFSGSPKLIAAYHVLHRLSLPRHPPYALCSLTIKKLYDPYYPRTYKPLLRPTYKPSTDRYIQYAIVKEQGLTLQ